MKDIDAVSILSSSFDVETLPRASQKDLDLLEENIRKMMREDVRSLNEIRNLLLTPETFSNSLGTIYQYLSDQKTCQNCPGRLSSCTKKSKGYQQVLYYDKDRDEVKTKQKECPYLSNILSILDRISPTDVPTFEMYQSFTSLSQLINNPDSRKAYMDTASVLFKETIALIHDAKKKKEAKGLGYRCINSDGIQMPLLKAICFMWAKSGYDVAFVDLKNLFYGLQSNDSSFVSPARRSHEKICSCKVLFLINLNNLNYLKSDTAVKYLYPILKSRTEKGKVTYFALDSGMKLPEFFRSRFYNTSLSDEAYRLTEDLFEARIIKDFGI